MSGRVIYGWLKGLAEEKGESIAVLLGDEVLPLEEIIYLFKVKTKSRKKEVLEPRQFFVWYCQIVLEMSCSEVGRMVGIDHATALHSKRVVNGWRETRDPNFLRRTEKIRKELNKIKPSYF